MSASAIGENRGSPSEKKRMLGRRFSQVLREGGTFKGRSVLDT
jgi:hypothetical protein